MRKLFLIALALCVCTALHGQERQRYLEIGMGANAYRGDLGEDYANWRGHVHAGLQFRGAARVNGSINLSLGSLLGESLNYRFPAEPTAQPNAFFTSNWFSLHGELQVNLLRKQTWLVYLSQGFGVIRFNPQDDQGQALLEQVNTRPEDELYNTTSVVLPTGIGATYFLPNGLGLDLHSRFLNTQTDYLDNISTWGVKQGNDKVMTITLSVLVPLN